MNLLLVVALIQSITYVKLLGKSFLFLKHRLCNNLFPLFEYFVLGKLITDL
jgi:hypothetical protein